MTQGVLLVIDDEQGVRHSLKMVFDKVFRVVEAATANDGVQKVTEEKPDIVLLDIVMPGL